MSNPHFRSDVITPKALNTGKLGQSGNASSSSSTSKSIPTNNTNSTSSHLDQSEENINKLIDTEIATLLESGKELLSLAIIGDKDTFRIVQETFQAEARADTMVRSAQTLSLLSESLKLSLLLSKTSDSALNDEAIQLIQNTQLHQLHCANLLESVFNLSKRQIHDWIQSIEEKS